MSVHKLNSHYVAITLKQEDLEESIAGLQQLKPILQAQVIRGNGSNKKQAAIDSAELGKHFETAIDAMTMILTQFDDYKD